MLGFAICLTRKIVPKHLEVVRNDSVEFRTRPIVSRVETFAKTVRDRTTTVCDRIFEQIADPMESTSAEIREYIKDNTAFGEIGESMLKEWGNSRD